MCCSVFYQPSFLLYLDVSIQCSVYTDPCDRPFIFCFTFRKDTGFPALSQLFLEFRQWLLRTYQSLCYLLGRENLPDSTTKALALTKQPLEVGLGTCSEWHCLLPMMSPWLGWANSVWLSYLKHDCRIHLKTMDTHLHSGTICNCPKLEPAHCPWAGGWVSQLVHLNSSRFLSNREEWAIDAYIQHGHICKTRKRSQSQRSLL